MLDATRNALKSYLVSLKGLDPTITDDQVKAAIVAFDGVPSGVYMADVDMRVISREEAARRLGVCPRRLDDYTATGKLKRFYMPGAKRALGIRVQDLNNLINAGVR